MFIRKNMEFKCIYCGEKSVGRVMHRGCVYDDLYDTIAKNKRLTETQYGRATNLHINIAELRKEVAQDRMGRI